MINLKRRYFPAVLAALGACGSVHAQEQTPEEMRQELKALRQRVEQLENGQNERALQAQAARVDQTIAEVSHDAEMRSQMLQAEGFTAGYRDGKFLIQSADGNFSLNPNLQFQLRGIVNSRESGKADGSDSIESGLELRRMKFGFDGNMFTKNLTYSFLWATGRSGGTPVLELGFVRYKFEGTPFAVRAGQYIDPYSKEQNTSSKRQLAVDRSMLNEVIGALGTGGEPFNQGVSLQYDDGNSLRGEIMLSDGIGTRNTNFTDTGGGAPFIALTDPHFGVSGRLEYKAAGEWRNYADFTALNNKADLFVVGAGFSYTAADNLQALLHTVDVQWEPASIKGLSLYAAYVALFRDYRTVAAGIESNPYDWGMLAQAGYMLNENWEVFARYDFSLLDDKAPAGAGTLGNAARISDILQEITVGVNYYLKGHEAKFTLDAVWLPNGSPLNIDGIGILAQPDDENQFLFRAQFQLLI